MDKFYTSVLIGALVLLILILVIVGVLMRKLHASELYPPNYATCPDYWDVSANPEYCGLYIKSGTAKNQGNLVLKDKQIDIDKPANVGLCKTIKKFGCKPSAQNAQSTLIPTQSGFDPANDNFQYIKLNNNAALTSTLFPGATDRCAKKRWADMMEITWDGVTNFNGC